MNGHKSKCETARKISQILIDMPHEDRMRYLKQIREIKEVYVSSLKNVESTYGLPTWDEETGFCSCGNPNI